MASKDAVEELIEQFRRLEDPRVEGRTDHDLLDVLVLALCAVMSGAEGWDDIEDWGRAREGWLRRYLKLRNGIPGHDTIRRVFEAISPRQLEASFASWMAQVCPAVAGRVIAIDGKSLRGAGSAARGLRALHQVSAYAAEYGLTLGQVACEEKSNEITAIGELLPMLALEGAVVTIDAMGCQMAIAEQITDAGGDYVLAVKDNQEHLAEALRDFFSMLNTPGYPAREVCVHETLDKGHGRLETRRCTAVGNLDWLDTLGLKDRWKNLTSVACIESTRVISEKTETDRRYVISSLPADGKRILHAVRMHWGIESVPQAHGKEVQYELTDCVQATRKMRVGPSESAFRSGLQTTPSCCGQEPLVVSVGAKESRTYLDQVRIRESNESEPSMTRRNPETCRQNQGRFYLLGQACRAPDYWASGGRRIGGENLFQASVRNCGNQSFRCQGRSTSGRNHKARVPMRSTGTDRLVVVRKAGNAAGAKGSGQAVAFDVQLATGGDG